MEIGQTGQLDLAITVEIQQIAVVPKYCPELEHTPHLVELVLHALETTIKQHHVAVLKVQKCSLTLKILCRLGYKC